MNYVDTLNSLQITDINKMFPNLVLATYKPHVSTWRTPGSNDEFDMEALILGGHYGYGGFWIPDSECGIKEYTYITERTESGSVFGFGTLMFDLDYKPSWKPELMTALSRTKLPWALCETPNGYHIHFLGEFWYTGNAQGWPSLWRFDYLRAYKELLKVGIKPDIKHVQGSLLQCRCYVRLQPKAGADYAWHDPLYIGTRDDLFRRVYLDDAEEYYGTVGNPGYFEEGTNYSMNAMNAIKELTTLRRDRDEIEWESDEVYQERKRQIYEYMNAEQGSTEWGDADYNPFA